MKNSTAYLILIFLFFPLLSLTNSSPKEEPLIPREDQIESLYQHNMKVLDTLIYEVRKH